MEDASDAIENLQKPRVLVTRPLPPDVEARLHAEFTALTADEDGPQGLERIAGWARQADALLITGSDRLSSNIIEALPETIRLVATFSVGTDHIDLAAARRRGLVVTNTPDVLTDATADITLLVMLGAARRAYEGQRMLRQGKWAGWKSTLLLGTDLRGKRLGILGMGRIGQAVAHRARAFGMAIHYHNRRPVHDDAMPPATFHDSLESLLAISDVLSINCPGTDETRHVIDAAAIQRLPPGAILINTARGNIVDESALITALASGQLRAAGLDVFENEPNVNPALLGLDNCYMLPHMGSATIETRNAMGFRCCDNIAAFFGGREPPSRVA